VREICDESAVWRPRRDSARSGQQFREFPVDDIWGAVKIAQQQIASDHGVRFYALAFPYALQGQKKENRKEGFMVATEREGLLSSLFVFFAFNQPAPGSTLTVSDPRACYRTDQPLLRSNREYNANALRQLGLGPLIDAKPTSGDCDK
jgi:hypothetical protein